MALGTFSTGKCFSTYQEAVDFYYGTTPVQIVPGATMYMTQYSKDGTVWNVSQYTKTGKADWALQSTNPVPNPSLSVCETNEGNFTDGMVIGWGIALAVITAWGIKLMREQIK